MKTCFPVRTCAALLAVALAVWSSSAAARAAGDAVQTRSLAPFDRIRTDGAFTTQIVAGRPQRVTITADPGLLGRVTTTVDNGTLVLDIRGGTNPFARQPRLSIEVPQLHGFANSGAGTVTISGLTGAGFELQNSGAAAIRASGRASRLAVALDGVGTIDTTALDARDVTVDNNGVGRISVRASGTLTMNVNGVGEIRYAGRPTQVESHVNGLGRIGRI